MKFSLNEKIREVLRILEDYPNMSWKEAIELVREI